MWGQVQFSLVETQEDFDRLAQAWSDLATRAHARPFQWFEWHDAWFKTMGAAAGWRPHVVVAKQGERLLAVMPLAMRRTRGIRLLDWSATEVTDYCDVLVDPEVDAPALASDMWKFVTDHGGFDIARLSQVRSDSTAQSLFEGDEATLRRSLQSYKLPITWRNAASWIKSQSSKMRQDIGRRTRRLDDSHVSYRICAQVDPWEPTLEALIEQKIATAGAKGRFTFVAHPGGADFLRRIAPIFFERRMLHLSALRSRSRYVSCHFGFVIDGTFYSYLASYDSTTPGHSPGTTILAHVIMWCCDNKIREMDMLTGGDEYKPRLGCETHELRTYVQPATVLGGVGFFGYRLMRPKRFYRGNEPRPATPIAAESMTRAVGDFAAQLAIKAWPSVFAIDLLPRIL